MSKAENPYLYAHTYELDEVIVPQGKRMMDSLIGRFDQKILDLATKRESTDLTLKEKYLLQIDAVQRGLIKAVDFAATECQHWIIDGNHVFPGLTSSEGASQAVIIAEWYMKVTDPAAHHYMLGGKTHKRTLTPAQFDNARILHDFTTEAAEISNKEIFEYTVNPIVYLSLIENAVKKARI
jgi:2-phosphoglycerate kinase